MHKDLSDYTRQTLNYVAREFAENVVRRYVGADESLALAREHLFNVLPALFDQEAARLEGEG